MEITYCLISSGITCYLTSIISGIDVFFDSIVEVCLSSFSDDFVCMVFFTLEPFFVPVSSLLFDLDALEGLKSASFSLKISSSWSAVMNAGAAETRGSSGISTSAARSMPGIISFGLLLADSSSSNYTFVSLGVG